MQKLLVSIFCFLALPVIAVESPYKNLNEYFQYLPNAVHRNWVPQKSNSNYEVTVQFSVKRNGEITEPVIVSSTNKDAEKSVIDAVKSGAPYAPLPAKYTAESIKTQVQLEYRK